MAYGQHGQRHKPRGSDPSECDVFRLVGDDGATSFINGSNAAPTADVPNPTPLQYRLSVGPPNILTVDGTAIDQYTDHQIEIQGDVTDVSPGDLVFVIPIEYRKETDLPCKGHDDAGNYVPCRLLSTGEFFWGVP